MLEVFDRSTLVIIPCCAAKASGGTVDMGTDPLSCTVSAATYRDVLQVREGVLNTVRGASKFMTDKYAKNAKIANGVDFGANRAIATMPALERYEGSLYRAEGLKAAIRAATTSSDGPRILILSALYGPLNPLSAIQDYNLMMSDSAAKPWALAFPLFLHDYTERNGIRRAALYVGSSTSYFKIARKAVAPLLAIGLLDEAVQYHVVNGSTLETPRRHGALLAAQLSGKSCAPFFDGGATVEVHL
jgi:hypothetical protein